MYAKHSCSVGLNTTIPPISSEPVTRVVLLVICIIGHPIILLEGLYQKKKHGTLVHIILCYFLSFLIKETALPTYIFSGLDMDCILYIPEFLFIIIIYDVLQIIVAANPAAE